MRKNARNKHNRSHERSHEVALTGRRTRKAAPNSLKFLAAVEGVEVEHGWIRGSNGMKWRLP